MQSTGSDQAPSNQRGGNFFKQRFDRWNFIALLFDRLLGQTQSQSVTHGGEQLQGFAVASAAATQSLAINRQAFHNRNFLFHHPLANQEVELRRINTVEVPEKSRVTRRSIPAGFGIDPAAQRP